MSPDTTLRPHNTPNHLSLTSSVSLSFLLVYLPPSPSPYLPPHFLPPNRKSIPLGFLWLSVVQLNGIFTSASIGPSANSSPFHSLGHTGECDASMNAHPQLRLLMSCLDVLVLHLLSPQGISEIPYLLVQHATLIQPPQKKAFPRLYQSLYNRRHILFISMAKQALEPKLALPLLEKNMDEQKIKQ